MLQLDAPWDLEELARYIVHVTDAMRESEGWSITLNGGRGGIIQTEVTAVSKIVTMAGDERRIETTDRRRYKLKAGNWVKPSKNA